MAWRRRALPMLLAAAAAWTSLDRAGAQPAQTEVSVTFMNKVTLSPPYSSNCGQCTEHCPLDLVHLDLLSAFGGGEATVDSRPMNNTGGCMSTLGAMYIRATCPVATAYGCGFVASFRVTCSCERCNNNNPFIDDAITVKCLVAPDTFSTSTPVLCAEVDNTDADAGRPQLIKFQTTITFPFPDAPMGTVTLGAKLTDQGTRGNPTLNPRKCDPVSSSGSPVTPLR